MFAPLTIVLPIFALILVGFICRRTGVLSPNAASELNRFVVYLALPALLFDVVAKVSWRELYQPGFIAAFTLGCGIVFCLTVGVRLIRSHPLANASIDGLNTAYANTGFIGFPLATAALGKESLPPTTIAGIITVCVLFATAIILIEIDLQSERNVLKVVRKVARSLATNPLLIAPVLGGLISGSGLVIPADIDKFFTLLGGAASPCALVSLGLFLGAKRDKPHLSAALSMVSLKLVLHPFVTWLLVTYVFTMPPLWAHTAVLMAALPTGTGSFMLAEFYNRDAATTSYAILISTIVSMITVTAYLSWLHH